MYPRNYHPDSSCPYGCDFDCGHFRDDRSDFGNDDSGERDFNAALREQGEYQPRYPGPSSDVNVWVTGSGERLRLDKMTDLHLARALAKCFGWLAAPSKFSDNSLRSCVRDAFVFHTAPYSDSCALVGNAGIDA